MLALFFAVGTWAFGSCVMGTTLPAARGCGGRGPYANSIEGRGAFEACRGGATGRNPRHCTPESWLGEKSIAKAAVQEGAKKGSVGQPDREVVSVPKRAEFSVCREWFHAADLVRGGERSWISAAVNLSMTFMGPPHLGQR